MVTVLCRSSFSCNSTHVEFIPNPCAEGMVLNHFICGEAPISCLILCNASCVWLPGKIKTACQLKGYSFTGDSSVQFLSLVEIIQKERKNTGNSIFTQFPSTNYRNLYLIMVKFSRQHSSPFDEL